MLHINHETTDVLKYALKSLSWAWQDENTLDKNTFSKLLNTHTPTPDDVIKLQALLKVLLETPTLKAQFFYDIAGTPVFKKETFLAVLLTKEFLPDSYTAYANHIGLNVWGQHLKDIQELVLDFPYKDCVLEGGQTKDDEKGTEVFYNEVLAPDAIHRLKAPKAFNKVAWLEADVTKLPAKQGKLELLTHQAPSQPLPTGVETFTPETHNLMIKGNNYIALNSLLARYQGKVKLIYIDPPYNTGGDSFLYNDKFSHSTWLVFMKNRLELARQLLRDDGVLIVQCDDNMQAELKILLNQEFGTENYCATFAIQMRFDNKSLNEKKDVQSVVEYTHIYFKNTGKLYREKIAYETNKFNTVITELTSPSKVVNLKGKKVEIFTEEQYSLEIGEPSKHKLKETWASGTVVKGNASGKFYEEYLKPRKQEDGIKCLYKVYGIGEDGLGYRYFTGAKKDDATQGKFYSGIPLSKQSKDATKEKAIYTLLKFSEEIQNYSESVGNCKGQGSVALNSGKKPEQLLENLIFLSTQPNDIVLDYHAGSGTTAAVAHKMGRRWVTIEQMDYIETLTKQRLINVINGDQTGVSKAVGWQGGGGFIYAELAQDAMTLITALENASTQEEVNRIRQDIATHRAVRLDLKTDAWLRDENYQFDKKEGTLFTDLSLPEQKKLLKQVIDKNKLYIPYDNMEDEAYAESFTETDRVFNKVFYEGEV